MQESAETVPADHLRVDLQGTGKWNIEISKNEIQFYQ